MIPPSASDDFLHGLVAVGMQEPELLRCIIGRLSKASRAHMRAASRACRTLMNNHVTCVEVGSCNALQTTDFAQIFPNADSCKLWVKYDDPGFEGQMSQLSTTFVGRLRSLDIDQSNIPEGIAGAACPMLLSRYVLRS
jgi:hypothetical protein